MDRAAAVVSSSGSDVSLPALTRMSDASLASSLNERVSVLGTAITCAPLAGEELSSLA